MRNTNGDPVSLEEFIRAGGMEGLEYVAANEGRILRAASGGPQWPSAGAGSDQWSGTDPGSSATVRHRDKGHFPSAILPSICVGFPPSML
jgi:hypothetical protein